jgi:hypothetical protein
MAAVFKLLIYCGESELVVRQACQSPRPGWRYTALIRSGERGPSVRLGCILPGRSFQ